MFTLNIFIICYLFAIYKGFKIKSGALIISPMFWLIASWGLIIGLYNFSGIIYNVDIELSTALYIAFNLLVFVIFYSIGKIMNNGDKSRNSEIYYMQRLNTKLYIKIALLGILMWLFDIYRLNSVAFGFRIEDLSISLIGAIGNMLLPLSLIIWLYELAFGIRFDKKLPSRAYLAATIFVVPSFVTAGRQPIIIICLSSVITLLYSLNQNKEYKYRRGIKNTLTLTIPLFISYLVLISNGRAGVSDKQVLFEYLFNSYTSTETINFVDAFGRFKDTILEGLYYYSHEIPMFGVLFKNYYFSPMFVTQFPYISRRLPSFLNLDINIVEVYLSTLYSRSGLSSHVWRTIIGSSIIDFGRIGGIFFIGILGFLTGIKKGIFRKKNSIHELIFQSVICTGIFFSIQFSPFVETAWAFPLFWLIIIPSIEKHIYKKDYEYCQDKES